MRQAGLIGLSDQLKRLSDCRDPLETMSRVVEFVVFRPALEKAVAYGGAKGCPRRACVRAPEVSDGAVHPHHRHPRAEAKIGLAILAYHIDRLIFHECKAAMG